MPDYVGGDVLARSWSVLAEDGVIVSTALPATLANTPAGRRGLWFMNTPDTERLQAIADDVADGRLRSKVAAAVRFDELPAAIERNRMQRQVGNTVGPCPGINGRPLWSTWPCRPTRASPSMTGDNPDGGAGRPERLS